MPTFRRLTRDELPRRGLARYGCALDYLTEALHRSTGPMAQSFYELSNADAHKRGVDPYFLPNDIKVIKASLDGAEPFFWSAQICDLLAQTARSLPDWTLSRSDVMVTRGWWWFDKAILVWPDDDAKMRRFGYVRAFSWIANGDALVFIPWGAVDGDTLTYPCPNLVWRYTKTLNEQVEHATSRIIDGVHGDGTTGQQARETVRHYYQLMATAFAFLKQQLIVTQTETPDRNTRRRAEAAGWTHNADVRLVYLRRPRRESEPSDDPVEWSCSWLVRGHWRQQFYPSEDRHRAIFIAPHVKGDPDKPLKPPSTRLFAVVK